MALIKCEECGKEISNTAKVCINCGAKTEIAKKTKKKIKKYSIILIGITLIIAIIVLININKPINKYRKEAKLIVNEYLNGNINNNYAYKKMDTLYDKIDREYKKNNDINYSILSAKVLCIKISLITDDYISVKEELEDL